jgi:hypothetical protein
MAFSDKYLDDRELPDEDDDDSESDTRACAQCGADVYEDAEQCPYCSAWLTSETGAWRGRAWWWIALGALGIVALLWALSMGIP